MKRLRVAASVALALTAVGLVLYARNAAPAVPPLTASAVADTGKPFVVKIHAQWCPVCMMTSNIWSQIDAAYGSRVHLVVLDFTNDENSERSRAEARRLGLDRMLDEYDGATGTIVVVNGRSKEVAASIKGSRDFAEYRAAIDKALNESRSGRE